MHAQIVDRVTPITLPDGTKNSDLPAILSALPSARELREFGSLVKSETPEALGLNPDYYYKIDTVLHEGKDYRIFYEYRDAHGRPCAKNSGGRKSRVNP